MPTITLPDGSQRTFDHPVSLAEIASDIGPGLAKAAVAGKIDGKLVDLSRTVEDDADIAIVTAKDQEGVEIIRHSTAHLMAQAVKQLFPEAQVTIGPVIDQGFYYDFAFNRPFNDEDLEKIETRMRELAAEGDELERRVIERDDAVRFFKDLGEDYKVEIIKDIPGEEQLTLYTQGDFTDLCRGPHVPHTNKLKAFKLLKVAGAYWRGDSDNEMLTRVYGTAFASEKELKRYLKQREEAEKRDHRRLGKQLDLFHFQDEAPGLVFWHPRGWAIWQVVESYMRDMYRRSGYAEIKCPQILDVSLWKKSGHWDNYQENMFFTESEKRTYAVKPMNCPGHVQVFNHGLHSYRDLPIRYGEFGSCHRNEPSGALHGILRVRGFTQDDGHIFCTEKQIESEVRAFHGQALEVYDTFGFSDVQVKIATRPVKRMGADEVWDEAEEALRGALRAANVEWEELPGEGAFYGPKIEYHLSDAIGRTWQLGTIQVDFMMPERLGATYVDENSERKHPVMLHRAIVGSMERFIGILIEHHAGQMPLWLAPVQAVTMGITDKHAEYVGQVAERLKAAGLRAEADLRNEKVGFKIREHTLERVPYLLVAGDREIDADSVSVRTRSGEDLGSIKVDELIERLKGEIAEHQ
ncbi:MULTISPECIES: threonine--tRNA ligase [unclassified Guyparkeria]|uniref:threonine--tRNA ligase n=1 Tax=unclassified Guyparkeria TaxID=2626246 RepID=UPI0007336F58|nr:MULTISPECIES: threonine--tRNA ligase [unclassified Guyparkeria]KTG16168.1 threonine--tRNA ligase [Guyparkeria sp. XI15]OAE85019.1 threonine--tRNA ligase [Guyparkeria sp. WRN-7]